MAQITGKTVYVLGARASHHTGAPLLRDFLVQARLLREGKDQLLHKTSFDRVFEWIDSLRGSSYYVEFDLDNLEHVFSLAEMSRQLGVGKGEKLFSDLRYVIMETLDRTQQLQWSGSQYEPDGLYFQFAQSLRDLNRQRQKHTGQAHGTFEYVCAVYSLITSQGPASLIQRGDAKALPWPDGHFDAVVTDPPYYDSVSYSNLSDAFYIWCKRMFGPVYTEHFSTQLGPKKNEGIAAAYRHNDDWHGARAAYEEFMAASLKEARRVLKPGAPIALVYAHKTTAGWATLVSAIQRAGFVITEAWPLSTEMQGGRKKVDRATLASSIFLVARKREGAGTGSYEDEVRPELERIVHARVEALWGMGITGADLVIAAVGAELRAFTRFAQVEYANGEEVPACYPQARGLSYRGLSHRGSRRCGAGLPGRSILKRLFRWSRGMIGTALDPPP